MSRRCFLSLFLLVANFTVVAEDLTKYIELIGSPYSHIYSKGEAIYARNTWDLQLFDGRLFIGAGNSSNRGPAQNSGPVPIIAYDLKTRMFIQEGQVNDEQIDSFKVLGQSLFIPGHDATQNWKWGNFYSRNQEGGWHKFRDIPGALHVYDMTLFQGNYYTALGIRKYAAVGSLKPNESQWQVEKLSSHGRVYGFLPIGDHLFAVKLFKKTNKPSSSMEELQEDGSFKSIGYTLFDMFPETSFKHKYIKMTRVLSTGSQAFYIGAYKHNDHQAKPFGLYSADLVKNQLKAKRIALAEGLIPRDIIQSEGHFWLLASKQNAKGYINYILTTDMNNLSEWREYFSFEYKGFARSFEKVQQDFYFGMGSDIASPKNWQQQELLVETGDILKLSKPSIEKGK